MDNTPLAIPCQIRLISHSVNSTALLDTDMYDCGSLWRCVIDNKNILQPVILHVTLIYGQG